MGKFSTSSCSKKPGEPEVEIVINISELDELLEDIKAARGTPQYDNLRAKYIGPDVGIFHNDDNDTIGIMSGWYADTNGNIVKKTIQ